MTNVVGPAIAIFDLDDTLSDTDHRQGVLEMPMKDIPKHMSRFDCMESLCAFDPPITAMVAKCIEHIERGDDVRFGQVVESASGWPPFAGSATTSNNPRITSQKSDSECAQWRTTAPVMC